MLRLGVVAAVLAAAILAVGGCSQQQPAQSNATRMHSEPVHAARASVQEQPKTAVVWIQGLSCPLCVQAIKKELWSVPGVGQIDVDYEHEVATVELASRKPPSRQQLEAAVQKTGYTLNKIEMR